MSKLESGTYRIICNGEWARDFPGQDAIVLSNHAAQEPTQEKWQITHVPGERYMIRHIATHLHAFADKPGQDLRLFPAVTEWYIQPAGDGKYRIVYPDRDSAWTSAFHPWYRGNRFTLKPFEGAANQLVEFVRVIG